MPQTQLPEVSLCLFTVKMPSTHTPQNPEPRLLYFLFLWFLAALFFYRRLSCLLLSYSTKDTEVSLTTIEAGRGGHNSDHHWFFQVLLSLKGQPTVLRVKVQMSWPHLQSVK